MAFTLDIGDRAPDFSLPAVDGKTHTLDDFAGSAALVVVFSCNHCPFVIGSEDRMNAFAADYAPRGVAMISINSNETENHPDDSFEHMVTRAAEKNFRFVYASDDDQSVALAYGALRTPHYFLFDADRKLRYTGRMDDDPRDAANARTQELRDAADAVLAGSAVPVELTNPLGCNVKWAGQDAHWMPPAACDLVQAS
jgi:peroxiredoxin